MLRKRIFTKREEQNSRDQGVWICYDTQYNIEEAWEWDVDRYELEFGSKKRIHPIDMRKGQKLF